MEHHHHHRNSRRYNTDFSDDNPTDYEAYGTDVEIEQHMNKTKKGGKHRKRRPRAAKTELSRRVFCTCVGSGIDLKLILSRLQSTDWVVRATPYGCVYAYRRVPISKARVVSHDAMKAEAEAAATAAAATAAAATAAAAAAAQQLTEQRKNLSNSLGEDFTTTMGGSPRKLDGTRFGIDYEENVEGAARSGASKRICRF